ncbi:MAG: hypothetical protein M3N05_03660 [Pseudomonadota bacterium]|nr:hypothetical protein [Pseudomonadota bacterium]
MLRLVLFASTLALMGSMAASQPAAPPTQPAQPGVVSLARTLLPVKDVMRHIVNPAAELYWKAAGEIDTDQGTVHRVPGPADDARWNAALDAAMVLQESGNLLMLQGRARDSDRWLKYAQQLADAGALAVTAAKARNEKQTFDAGSALYNACYACHGKYIPRPANSLYGHKTRDEDFKPPK